jgi:hypothetical protein
MNKIRDFSWSSAVVSGTKAASIHLPQDLFHPPQSTIKNVPLVSRLAGYRYFRAGVKLRMTVNATLFHSGKLMFTWMPHYRSGMTIDATKNSTMYQAANNRPIILDVPSNSSLVMDIPWITPFQWIDLDRYVANAGTWDDYIGLVDIWVLHPLTNASASSPSPSIVNVTIEAAFTDAEVAAFMPTTYISPTAANDLATCQMEVIEKSAKGIVSGVSQLGSHIAHTVASIPVLAEAASKTLVHTVDGLGLNKPTGVASAQPVNLSLAPDFSFGEGLDYSSKLSMVPSAVVATDPSLYSEGEDMMDIYKIARTPSLRYTFTVTSASAVGAIVHTECCDPMYCSPEATEEGLFAPTYVSWVSLPFTYYSGGLKWFLMITAPKTVTAKLRLSWTPSEVNDVDQFALLGGEFPSRIIDITGSTQTEFTTPFMSPYTVLPVTTFQRDTNPVYSNYLNSGFWQLSILNPVTGSTSATSVIHIAIWKAAAEDYRLYKPREIMDHFVSLSSKEKDLTEYSDDDDDATVQCDVWNFYKKQFMPIVPVNFVTHEKICSGESVSNLRTLMHRYVFIDSKNATASSAQKFDTVPFPGYHPDGVPNQHWYWLQLFYFWRGSLRFKLLFKQSTSLALPNNSCGIGRVVLQTTNTPVAVETDTPWNTFNGATVYHTDYRPSVEFEIPWYYQTLFATVLPFDSPNSPVPPDDRLSVPGFTHYRVQNNGTTLQTSPSFDMYMSVGDDFSMGFLSAPPLVQQVAMNKIKVTTTLRDSNSQNRNLHSKELRVKTRNPKRGTKTHQ